MPDRSAYAGLLTIGHAAFFARVAAAALLQALASGMGQGREYTIVIIVPSSLLDDKITRIL
jgi:hypothetical protein